MKIWRPILGLALFFTIVESFSLKATQTSTKEALLKELDDPNGFNSATKRRTTLVAKLITENRITSPGSANSFTPLAVGTWQIVYAPHIYTMGSLLGGSFSPVIYIMKPNGIMTSHARYNFPIIGSGWLSVSGTYGSQDEDKACRVDFDTAWVRLLTNGDNSHDAEPYDSLEAVPPSPWKDVIQALGKILFIDAVSVFPVSYLDEDTIVFDFELLGTRICARKVGPVR
jgi:hypothetical protein